MLQKNRGDSGILEMKKSNKIRTESFRENTFIWGGIYDITTARIYDCGGREAKT